MKGIMKGVKDEDKHFDPLFPRISISEAERGGPKAPPRNKMALCEQLTMATSHRFNNGSMPMIPHPPPSTSTSLTASSPPSHVDCHKKSLFSPFSSRNGHDFSPGYHDLGVRHHPHSSNGVTNSTLMAPEFRSLVPMSYQSAVHWPPTSKHSMFQPHCFLNSRNSTAERKTEQVNKVPEIRENHVKRPAYILSTKLKTLPDATSGLSSRGRDAEPNVNEDLSIGQKRKSLSDDIKIVDKPSIHLDHDYKSLLENKASKDRVPASSETFIRKRSTFIMEGPSRSMEELGYKHKSLTRLTAMDECHKDKDCGSEPGEINDQSDSMSDASVVKSVSNFVVSTDDVVRVIGQERFWKARRTILHQQRILAAQLFDLHRLVKVQRLMAESPEMIFEDNISRKPSLTLLHSRKLFAETNREIKANLQESNFKIEHIPESANRKPPPPLNTDKVLYTRQPPPIPRPMELIVPPVTTDTKSSSLIFHPPPGNQWLIPVRSPSEGLVYKPYTGPLPPTAGILSPVYDNFAPITLRGVTDPSFLNTPYSLPASNLQGLGNLSTVSGHSALGQSYLQPLPIPQINASGSTSTFEPIRKFIEHPIVDQDSSIPICKHLEVCKGNELQDSTAASPLEKKKVDILSLFPTTPSHHPPLSSSVSEQKIQVIKVVPHNRKSASESAARIFQTIQEERKQHG